MNVVTESLEVNGAELSLEMGKLAKTLSVGLLTALVAGCNSSDGTTSEGGGSSADASFCVTRTLRTVYANDCEFDVNVIVFEPGAQPFEVNANSAKTQSESVNSFGACRAPSKSTSASSTPTSRWRSTRRYCTATFSQHQAWLAIVSE